VKTPVALTAHTQLTAVPADLAGSNAARLLYAPAASSTTHWNAGVPSNPHAGRKIGSLGLQTDITERKENERELRTTERELERQNEQLEEFASVVSHDIRNPLSIARGRAAMLAEEAGNECHEHLRPLGDALDRMEQIITDTLTVARQGQTVGEMTPIPLVDLVGKCLASVDTGTTSLEVADEGTLQGDEDRLRHVFESLFRNAIEHGGGEVTVRVGVTDDGALYVEGDGPGIPPAERETVLEAGHTSAAGGTGFGLTIVKRIAEAHGGTVGITEGRDGGARFEFDDVMPPDS
jgi:signal transduction histidine kinase